MRHVSRTPSSFRLPSLDRTVSGAVVVALERLLNAFVAGAAGGDLPRQPYDERWISPCQVGEPDADGTIAWRPVRRPVVAGWSGLERALETTVHPDVAAFYGSFWCDCIPVTADEGTATLVQVWNEDDFAALQENLIGHALQKMRRGESLTLFVACTDESDFNLCVDNETGAVVLERPGEPPSRQVAATLAELLARMEPLAPHRR